MLITNNKRDRSDLIWNQTHVHTKKMKTQDIKEIEIDEIASSSINTHDTISTSMRKLTEMHIEEFDLELQDYSATRLPILWQNAKNHDWVSVKDQLNNTTFSTRTINFTPTEDSDEGMPLLLLAATSNQWDIVKTILYLHPSADLDVSPNEGIFKATTLLWWAIFFQKWDVVEIIFKMNPNPKVNDSSPDKGPYKGMTLLWIAMHSKNWILTEKILDLYPKPNVNAYPASNAYKQYHGMTVLWMACIQQQWKLAEKMITLDRNADINVSPEKCKGATPLLIVANNSLSESDDTNRSHFTLLKIMLESHPKPDLTANEIPYENPELEGNHLSEGFKGIVEAIELSTRETYSPKLAGDKALSAIVSYLCILGVDHASFEYKKNSISRSINRINTIFNDSWNNCLKKPFQDFNNDLIDHVVLNVLYGEQKKLKSFLRSVILEKIKTYSDDMYEVNHSKALNHIATLAFNEFRWQNGLSDQAFTKAQIKDFRELIIDCLKQFEQQHEGVQYTKEKRERLIKEIGRDQNVDFTSLEKAFIQQAIQKAMSTNLILPLGNRKTKSDDLYRKTSDVYSQEPINSFIPNIFEEHIDEYISKSTGVNREKAFLLQAAFKNKWEIVSKTLRTNTETNLDAKTLLRLLWIATIKGKWNFIKETLNLPIWTHLDQSRIEGRWTTQGLLESATVAGQWDIVRKTLELNLKVDLTNPIHDNFFWNEKVEKLNQEYDDFAFSEIKFHENQECTFLIEYLSLLDCIMIASQKNSSQDMNQDLSAIMSYLIIILGINGPKNHLQWQQRVKTIPFDQSKTHLTSPWCNPLGEAFLNLFQKESGISSDSFENLLSQLSSLPLSTQWEKRAELIINTFDRLTASFNDPWLDPSEELFQNLLESLDTQRTLDAVYEKHPELKTFPSSVLIEKMQAFAINKHKANHDKALNDIATLAFEDFRLQNRLSNREYTEAQIKDFHRLIVSCLEEFQEMHEEMPFTKENLEHIVKEIGKHQNVAFPKLKKSIIQKAIQMTMIS